MTLHPSTQCLLNNIPVLSVSPTDQPSSPDSHRTAPITLDSFVPCAKTVTSFSSARSSSGVRYHAICAPRSMRVFFPRMVRFPWTPQSSFVPPLLSRAASDCLAPFQAPGSLPLLHLSTVCSWGPTYSWPALFHHALLSASVFLLRLFSPPLSFLCASQTKIALHEVNKCAQLPIHTAHFPFCFSPLGSSFISSCCSLSFSLTPYLHYHWIPLPLTNFSFPCPLLKVQQHYFKTCHQLCFTPSFHQGPWSCSTCVCLLLMSSF